jgi:SNF2 family DNA or RNA helicase
MGLMEVLVDKRTDSLVLKAIDPFELRDLLPRSRSLPHPDWNFATHHTIDSTRVLRNMGYDVPAPIRHQYDWPGRFVPFEHQIVMSDFLTMHRRCFNLSEMGTMKTNAALWAADWLMKTGRVRKALIGAPLSTLSSVWQNDIFETLPHRTTAILHGPVERRLKHLAIEADFYVINHDGFKIAEVAAAITKRPDIDLLVIDEAGMFRNHSSAKYKALYKLINARPDLRVWLMTGTPCPNAPTDAWGLARLVDPSRVPKFAGAFQRDTMMKVSNFKWVARVDAFEKAYAAMQPAIRFKKKDCISLPPVVTRDISAGLTPAQAATVKQLKDHMVTTGGNGSKIVAANVADQINKMRQVLCGALKDPATGQYHPIPHAPRLTALMDAINSASAKVIVVVPFKGIIRLLEAEVGKTHTCAIVNGDVPQAKRTAIFEAFKKQSDPQVLLCHPAVMAHGLNLTEADVLIFYAPIYSNDEVEQVNERFNRAGQTRNMTIIRIGSHPLEWAIYKMTDTKKEAQNSIMELYEAATREAA